MVRIHLDEAVDRGDRGGAFAVLPVRIGDLELRLLREPAVRVARLELLEVADGARPVLVAQGFLGLALELLRRPADGFILGVARETGEERRK